MLASAIGRYDGNVYQALFDWVRVETPAWRRPPGAGTHCGWAGLPGCLFAIASSGAKGAAQRAGSAGLVRDRARPAAARRPGAGHPRAGEGRPAHPPAEQQQAVMGAPHARPVHVPGIESIVPSAKLAEHVRGLRQDEPRHGEPDGVHAARQRKHKLAPSEAADRATQHGRRADLLKRQLRAVAAPCRMAGAPGLASGASPPSADGPAHRYHSEQLAKAVHPLGEQAADDLVGRVPRRHAGAARRHHKVDVRAAQRLCPAVGAPARLRACAGSAGDRGHRLLRWRPRVPARACSMSGRSSRQTA